MRQSSASHSRSVPRAAVCSRIAESLAVEARELRGAALARYTYTYTYAVRAKFGQDVAIGLLLRLLEAR